MQPSRNELVSTIKSELYESTNWQHRRTFIFFCRCIIRTMPIAFFKKHFLREYISLSTDKLLDIRKAFIQAIIDIKPYFDQDVDIMVELADIIQQY